MATNNIKWVVGDHCRTLYPLDLKWYEAKILSIKGGTCIVELVGYGNRESANLVQLLESKGRKARKTQIKLAARCASFFMSNSDDSLTSDGGSSSSCSISKYVNLRNRPVRTRNQPSFKKAENSSSPHSSADYQQGATGCEAPNQPWTLGDFCLAEYSVDQIMYEAMIVAVKDELCAVEFLGYGNMEIVNLEDLQESNGPEARNRQIKAVCGTASSTNKPFLPTAPAPAPNPPDCQCFSQDPINAMLVSWYMAGYNTGFYQAREGMNCNYQHCCHHVHGHHH